MSKLTRKTPWSNPALEPIIPPTNVSVYYREAIKDADKMADRTALDWCVFVNSVGAYIIREYMYCTNPRDGFKIVYVSLDKFSPLGIKAREKGAKRNAR